MGLFESGKKKLAHPTRSIMELCCRNAVLILAAYVPFSWELNFKMSDNLGKNIRMYFSKFYVFTHIFLKNWYLWAA
jgi:hypothetical protein